MKNSFIPFDFHQQRKSSTLLRGKKLIFYSVPGLPDWVKFPPAAILLAENVDVSTTSKVLILGGCCGAIASILSDEIPGGEIWISDLNSTVLRMSELTLNANQIMNVRPLKSPEISSFTPELLDVIAIELPKGRNLIRRWLAESYQLLSPGGLLYLAGANNSGINPAIKDATSLFGEMSILAYKKGNRVARFVKSSPAVQFPDWFFEPGIHPGSWIEFQTTERSFSLTIRSLPGIFSSNTVDPGTQLLLDSIDPFPGASVLDLGCGYGIIGIVAALLGAGKVDLIDNNLYAVAAASENIRINQITAASSFVSDVTESVIDRLYDVVLMNPPFHVGQPVDYQLTQAFIEGSWQVLSTNGMLILVYNRFLPILNLIKTKFSKTQILNENSRYQVIGAEK